MSTAVQGPVKRVEPKGEDDPQILAIKQQGIATILTLWEQVRAAGGQEPEVVQRCAAASLAIAQAVVILDPALVAPQGVPPDALQPPRAAPAKDTDTPSHSVFPGRG